MKANVRMLRKRRIYSDDFKRELVKLYERGDYNVGQLGSLYSVHSTLIYRWIYRFSQFNKAGGRIIEMKESASNKVKQLEQRVKELERMLGQKQIKIDFLETMIDVAKDELNIDIKKKSFTPPSKSSGNAKKS